MKTFSSWSRVFSCIIPKTSPISLIEQELRCISLQFHTKESVRHSPSGHVNMAPTGGFNFKIWPSLAIIITLAHRSESAGHQATDRRKITRKWQDVGTRFTEVNSEQFVPRWTWGSFILWFIPYTDLSLTEINISAGNVLEDTIKLFLCQSTERSQRNFTSSEWRRTWNFTPTSTDRGSLVPNN